MVQLSFSSLLYFASEFFFVFLPVPHSTTAISPAPSLWWLFPCRVLCACTITQWHTSASSASPRCLRWLRLQLNHSLGECEWKEEPASMEKKRNTRSIFRFVMKQINLHPRMRVLIKREFQLVDIWEVACEVDYVPDTFWLCLKPPGFSEGKQHPTLTGDTTDYRFLSPGRLGFSLKNFLDSPLRTSELSWNKQPIAVPEPILNFLPILGTQSMHLTLYWIGCLVSWNFCRCTVEYLLMQ